MTYIRTDKIKRALQNALSDSPKGVDDLEQFKEALKDLEALKEEYYALENCANSLERMVEITGGPVDQTTFLGYLSIAKNDLEKWNSLEK